ncbi:GNAT family N-acetyltransferase [Massilia agilis]|uniref:GNAT family N-acetyltransferase n=1 Tax=Massilia agilis TaxID=1811226 RepID=A0ABT2D842_9BURK|nr:GNAT family N-acetyltransferase [Massilia agilis]MCS0807450.1 GNAT family N-acetyltransferase [Massilia agilis]
MKILTIDDKAQLLQHKLDIETLFLECFGARLSLALWHWAYIDNPNGQPFVSLCYDGDRLVGHYAMVPMPLSGSGRILNAYLSMTTMVAASHRQHGLFVKLAGVTYEAAIAQGVDFVMGFPNAMSTPGFRKKLGWVLPEPDYVARVTKAELLDPAVLNRFESHGGYRLDLEDERTRQWRTAKPGCDYICENGLVYKRFDGGIDLMYFASVDALRQLPDDAGINLLLPHDFGRFQENKVFDYQFGGLSLAGQFDPAGIKRQMCLSDVF